MICRCGAEITHVESMLATLRGVTFMCRACSMSLPLGLKGIDTRARAEPKTCKECGEPIAIEDATVNHPYLHPACHNLRQRTREAKKREGARR